MKYNKFNNLKKVTQKDNVLRKSRSPSYENIKFMTFMENIQ